MPSPRVMLFGIDGASPQLLQDLVSQGKLPTLSRLLHEGTLSELVSTIPVESPTAWSSMMTGTNPGKHGVFSFSRRIEDSYVLKPVNLQDVSTKSLFELLSEAGKKVIGVSIPLMYPPPSVNGILLSGLLSPMTKLSGYPEDIVAELNTKFGNPSLNIQAGLIFQSRKAFLDNCAEVTRNTLEISEHLLSKYPWDFFMVVFHSVDETQHFFWDDMEGHSKYRGSVFQAYDAIDKSLSRLLAFRDEETHVMVVSDHGHGPVSDYFCTNLFLEKHGYLHFKATRFRTAKHLLYRLSGATGTRRIALALMNAVGSFTPASEEVSDDPILNGTDWTRTKAYSYSIGVNINLQGREPKGIVPLSQYEAFRKELVSALKKYTDKKNQGILDLVATRDDVYDGPEVRNAPDIVLESENYMVYGLAGLGSANVYGSVLERPPVISGTHRRNGVFMLSGPWVQPDQRIEKVSILDVAPTIMTILGVPVPDGLDGGVVTKAFLPSASIQERVRRSSASNLRSAEAFQWSKDDEEQIRKNLKALGYIE